MNERDKNILLKIESEAVLLLGLADGYDMQGFLANEGLQRAVCLTLINIGELVKLITEEIKQQNPSIPWRAIAGLRDVVAHGYFSLRMEDIWETGTKDLTPFLTQIREILQRETVKQIINEQENSPRFGGR
jgi:uncharacterized protein with HEPN domain